jgi:manganese-dependent ADP-ribose/CDP-alcohol diphosphatase
MSSSPRIGLLADIQFGDLADRGSCRFRSSLERLEEAVQGLNRAGCDLVLQLGDLVEGHGDSEGGRLRTREDLERVLAVLERLEAPVEHLVGNHCLSLPRAELEERLGLEAPWRALDARGLRVLLLDSCWLSPLGREPGDPIRTEAEAWLAAWRGRLAHALPWNGGFGSEQLDWLTEQASSAEGPLLVASHHPVHPGSARAAFLAWDHEEALRAVRAAGGSSAPRPLAWVSGHDHRGGVWRGGSDSFRTASGLVAGKGFSRLEVTDLDGLSLLGWSWSE